MKRIILAFLLSFTFSLFMQGQVTDQNALAYRKATKENKKAPSYPGGIEEYYRFMNENLNMDIVGDTTMWKGSVSVFYFFDTSGKCIRFTREGSYTSQVNREFERVLKLMPDWIEPHLYGFITNGITEVVKILPPGNKNIYLCVYIRNTVEVVKS